MSKKKESKSTARLEEDKLCTCNTIVPFQQKNTQRNNSKAKYTQNKYSKQWKMNSCGRIDEGSLQRYDKYLIDSEDELGQLITPKVEDEPINDRIDYPTSRITFSSSLMKTPSVSIVSETKTNTNKEELLQSISQTENTQEVWTQEDESWWRIKLNQKQNIREIDKIMEEVESEKSEESGSEYEGIQSESFEVSSDYTISNYQVEPVKIQNN